MASVAISSVRCDTCTGVLLEVRSAPDAAPDLRCPCCSARDALRRAEQVARLR